MKRDKMITLKFPLKIIYKFKRVIGNSSSLKHQEPTHKDLITITHQDHEGLQDLEAHAHIDLQVDLVQDIVIAVVLVQHRVIEIKLQIHLKIN